ncbi:30S ribosomal protein S6e [Candidatus Woesearchaeota archaeon]|nr:30S ribosomal protein S6e [Candidatus Woesearchaeota archaeon]
MAEFKLNIADAKTGKCMQKIIADLLAGKLIGLKIGSAVKGDDIGIAGYEFQITGGSDKCGFPMRKGISSERKRILIKKGTGFRSGRKGMKKRKTICGETINAKISQINLKITKHGKENLFKKEGEEKPAPKEAPKIEKKEEPKEKEKPKQEAKPEEKKEEKPK